MNFLSKQFGGVLLCIVVSACTPSHSVRDTPDQSSIEASTVDALAAGFRDSGRRESILFWNTEQRRIGFKHIDQIFPTRQVTASEQPLELIPASMDLSGVSYQVDGGTFSLSDFVSMPAHIGLIVLLDNKVLFEHYADGNDRDSLWISFSVTKSITSMLIGAAIHDGFIESVDEPVVNYLPRLRGTAYENATIENVLQMASGVKWNEDYADPNSDVALAGGANGIALVDYLAQLPAEGTPGATFNYNTGETNLVGAILRAAIGNNASTYLEHKIWRTFGMESNAHWVLGSEGGAETGGCCLNATLRDYARIGLFAMNDGVLKDGTRVLPEGWMRQSTTPSKGYPGYGYLWWLNSDGSYSAQGIFSQMIVIDPARRLVIAMHNSAPTAVGSKFDDHVNAVISAIQLHIKP